jgi:hypothetical protein
MLPLVFSVQVVYVGTERVNEVLFYIWVADNIKEPRLTVFRGRCLGRCMKQLENIVFRKGITCIVANATPCADCFIDIHTFRPIPLSHIVPLDIWTQESMVMPVLFERPFPGSHRKGEFGANLRFAAFWRSSFCLCKMSQKKITAPHDKRRRLAAEWIPSLHRSL